MNYGILKMEQFDQYYELLKQHFPKKEVKEYNFLKSLISTGECQVLTLKEGDKIAGCVSYFVLNDYVFIDYFVVSNMYQGQGWGHKMMSHFKNELQKPIILEVEYPENEQQERRICFYESNEFVVNEHEYFVPPVRGMKEPMYFHLMTYPKALTEDEYVKIYDEIMEKVYVL